MMPDNTFLKELPVWFINLDSSLDRRIKIVNDFDKYGIKRYEKISAIDGKNTNFISKRIPYHDRKLTSGEIGGVLSYLNAIQKFVDSNLDYVLICDDDVNFYYSTKITFNFYDSLTYHNPKKYCLKLNALDINYFFPEKEIVFPNKLTKPSHTSYGNATIINKAWAIDFLNTYKHEFNVTRLEKSYLLKKYIKNINDIPKAVIPSCDALTFTKDTFVWRVLGVTDFESTMFPENTKQLILDPYNKVLDNYMKNINEITIEEFKRNGCV